MRPATRRATRTTRATRATLVLLALASGACSRDATADRRLRVTVLGPATDVRVGATREAVAHWNGELRRLGVPVAFDAVTVRDDSVPDATLRAAGAEAPIGIGPGIVRLLVAVADVPGDVVVVLARTDLISFGLASHLGSTAVVAIRRADVPPLATPNVPRNVVAHELGHVLGLRHGGDPATLMCGRPAACRPAAFASDRPRFFPLSADDERALRARWR